MIAQRQRPDAGAVGDEVDEVSRTGVRGCGGGRGGADDGGAAEDPGSGQGRVSEEGTSGTRHIHE